MGYNICFLDEKIYMVSLKELENMPLIVPNERCRPGEYIRSMFEERGLNLNIAYECDRPRQTIDVVSNNPNLAARIILDDVIAQDLEHIKVLVLEDEPFLLPVCLINRKGRKLSMRERLFQHLTIDSYKGQAMDIGSTSSPVVTAHKNK